MPLATPAVTAYVGPPRSLGAMPGLRPTRMAASLAAAGLDVTNLPPLESLAPGPKQRVMRTFTEALGVPCVGCHSADELRADTRRKRVARRMWNEIVRVVALNDGSPVYCDSCHDGALFHLDRRDTRSLAAYMCNEFVGRLKRVDGRSHDCTTCHGDPPDLHLVDSWKSRPAPAIVGDLALEHWTRADVIVPRWPMEGPRDPADCGTNGELCPLAAWMRLIVTPAMHDRDREELARSLDRVAAYAPEMDGFVAKARAASAAARRGDFVSVDSECGACHAAYKAEWRANHRKRAPD